MWAGPWRGWHARRPPRRGAEEASSSANFAKARPPLRGLRADLLRRLGRDAELARALESDAELAIGPELVDLLREQADRLDRIGESDRALEVRLAALAEAPGDLGLLAPARRRLEA